MRTWLAAALVLLAGCVVDETDSSPRVVSAHGSGPGLDMNATVTSDGGRHGLEAHARNVGRSTYNVSSICSPVFTHEVRHEGERVWPEPEVICAAYGVKPFPPGARESFSISWDGAFEDGTQARAGDYLWVVRFHYQAEASGAWENVTLEVPFRVR